VRVYEVDDIRNDRCFVAERACDGHDDVGMANIGIDFQLLLSA
jgi:hypothetical protein